MAIIEDLGSSAEGRRRLGLKCPATLEPAGEFEVATADDVRAAVERARAAQPAWAALGFKDRARYLLRALDLLIEKQDEFASVVCRETGKSRLEAIMIDVLASCDALAFWAKRSEKILADRRKRMHLLSPFKKLRIIYRPLGVIGIITPWNGPFVLSLNPSVQALMAGNTVVLKPSEVTPYSGKLVGDLLAEAGLPEGVLEVVLGDGSTGSALLEADVDKIAFTGSVATGRKIGEACGRRLLPCTLELGGKDPFIVCADADLDRAAAGAAFGACLNSGQVCMSVERVYVVDSVADEFIGRVVEHVGALEQVVHGISDVGPIFWPPQLKVIERHIEDALARGARILVGGKRNDKLEGLYFEPTVVVDVTHDMAIMREETFGPVVPIMRVEDEEEAIRLANDTSYGLTASVWTRDRAKGLAYARRLNAGSVCINDAGITYGALEAPFGGIKNSGVGCVNGEEGLRGYCYAQPVISLRFGGKREPIWYPHSEKLVAQVKKGVRFMWGGPLRRLFS